MSKVQKMKTSEIIPKVDLHRHAGGAISSETVWEIIQSKNDLLPLASSLKKVESIMTYKHDDKTNLNFHKFLQKFNILNYIQWNENNIDWTIKQIISDLADEDIQYCELRFSIAKYLNNMTWDEQEACLFFLNRIKHWSTCYGVKVGPVLSIKYEAAKIESVRMSKLINHWKIAEDIVGIDVVGDESHFNKKFLGQIFRYWQMCNKGTLIHAGETQSAENVRSAIEMGVNRIAHGIAAAEHPDIMDLAIENDVIFDIALTSNYITGVVEKGTPHPARKLLDHGCKITIGTDDPTIFDLTLDQEYTIAKLELGLSDEELIDIKRNSVIHALSEI